jgi:hypothetical protein
VPAAAAAAAVAAAAPSCRAMGSIVFNRGCYADFVLILLESKPVYRDVLKRYTENSSDSGRTHSKGSVLNREIRGDMTDS